jgi:hypothetical protein
MYRKTRYFFNDKEIDASCLQGGWLSGEQPKLGDLVLKVRARKPKDGEFYMDQSEVFVDKLHEGNWGKFTYKPYYFKKTGIVTPVKRGKYGQSHSIPVEEFIRLHT